MRLKNGKTNLNTKDMMKIIGNKFKVELGDKILMIRDLKGNLLKADSVDACEDAEKFNELCEMLELKIAERTKKGLAF